VRTRADEVVRSLKIFSDAFTIGRTEIAAIKKGVVGETDDLLSIILTYTKIDEIRKAKAT
jgi:hypothetical protein